MGVPDEPTWNQMTEAARRNIELSTQYLRAKLDAVSVLSELAVLGPQR